MRKTLGRVLATVVALGLTVGASVGAPAGATAKRDGTPTKLVKLAKSLGIKDAG